MFLVLYVCRMRKMLLLFVLSLLQVVFIAFTVHGTDGAKGKRGLLPLHQCCDDRQEPKRLFRCLANYISAREIEPELAFSPRIILVTYISSHILEYASNFLLYNLYYLEEFSPHFALKLLTEETDEDYSPEDRRWNKIFAIYHGFDSWARNYDFIIYIDADVLFLPPNSKGSKQSSFQEIIEKSLEQNPNAHLILSEDLLDYGNSGVMIVRNHPWSREFFHRWIRNKDSPNTNCDQHVLNKLSLQLQQRQDLHHIMLLPFPLLNSKFPAIESFASLWNHHYNNDSSSFQPFLIHFLGEYREVREAIGQNYSSRICRSLQRWSTLTINTMGAIDREKTRFIPPSITPRSLIELKTKTLQQMIQQSLDRYESAFDVNQTSFASECFDRIQHYCHFQKGLNLTLSSAAASTASTASPGSSRKISPERTCQDYLLSFSQISGNSLHYQYLQVEKKATASSSGGGSFSRFFQQVQVLFHFYEWKVSATIFEASLPLEIAEGRSRLWWLIDEELSMLQDLVQQIDSLLRSSKKSLASIQIAQMEGFMSFWTLQQRIRLLQTTIANESVVSQQSRSILFPMIKREEKLMSDLYSLINLLEGEQKKKDSDSSMAAHPLASKLLQSLPHRLFLLQEQIMNYIESCLRLMRSIARYSLLKEAQEWCGIAINNIELLVSRYQGEERLLVNLQRKVYFQCAAVYSADNENDANRELVQKYREKAERLRYHAANHSHYYPEEL